MFEVPLKSDTYKTLFSRISCDSFDGKILHLAVPNLNTKNCIAINFLQKIQVIAQKEYSKYFDTQDIIETDLIIKQAKKPDDIELNLDLDFEQSNVVELKRETSRKIG